jgi:hypothetical protein
VLVALVVEEVQILQTLELAQQEPLTKVLQVEMDFQVELVN